MSSSPSLTTDYLVVGAGTIAMGFVDTLIDNPDVDVVLIDRRHAPGGHWLDAYPFVQLHQPSMNYGVNSTPLGRDRVELEGRDAGFYERASGAEICSYYDDIMRHRFLASGRVRFFPMCDYVGGGRFRSRLTGDTTDVTVRRHVVDATYMASAIPATDPPPFAIGDGVNCIPVGELTDITDAPAGYVIVGAGKTAMDAVGWLLDQGTPPDAITWIRSSEPWTLNRAFFQPGEGAVRTLGSIVTELEAFAECDSIDDAFTQLEEHDITFRIDESVTPRVLRGATLSRGELEQLRRVENVVRLGRVRRIDRDSITLEHGSIPTTPGHVHVHCAAAGLSDKPPRPIFTDDGITLQPITRVSISLSAGVIGLVEASGRPTAEKNTLCRANPWFHTPFDWARHLLTGMRTEMEWQRAPELVDWLEASRLNIVKGLTEHPDTATVAALQGRFLNALFPALEKLDKLSASATPAEQARIYEPAATS